MGAREVGHLLGRRSGALRGLARDHLSGGLLLELFLVEVRFESLRTPIAGSKYGAEPAAVAPQGLRVSPAERARVKLLRARVPSRPTIVADGVPQRLACREDPSLGDGRKTTPRGCSPRRQVGHDGAQDVHWACGLTMLAPASARDAARVRHMLPPAQVEYNRVLEHEKYGASPTIALLCLGERESGCVGWISLYNRERLRWNPKREGEGYNEERREIDLLHVLQHAHERCVQQCWWLGPRLRCPALQASGCSSD